MKSFSLPWRGPVAALAASLACGADGAIHELTISWAGVGAGSMTVADGDFLDLDAAIDKIRFDFSITVDDGVNGWKARGTLRGEMTGPSDATTVLEDLVINKVRGIPLADQHFNFSHKFFQLGPPQPETRSSMSGYFDSILTPGFLGGAQLVYTSRVEGLGGVEVVDLFGIGPVGGLAPIPFASDGGPVLVHHPFRHTGEMIFYLDTDGDSIITGDGEGFGLDSAPIPGPGGVVVLMAVVAMRRRRGRCDGSGSALLGGK